MYLSPTAYLMFKRDPVRYYLQYLSPDPTPREPATKHMLVGTVFDVLVKHHLSKDLELQEQPCDLPQDADAIRAGKHVFDTYVESGAYVRLRCQLEDAGEIRMEDRTTRDIGGGCILSGYPDLSYVTNGGVPVILDFKVNGYFAKTTRSPVKGWLRLYSEKEGEWFAQEYHKDVVSARVGDVEINSRYGFEVAYPDWAVQLSMYGWMLGYEEFVTQVEQIVGKPGEGRPTLRIACHSTMSTPQYLAVLRADVQQTWEIVNSDHIFRDMSKEDSAAKCRLLDRRALVRDLPNELMVVENAHAHWPPRDDAVCIHSGR